MKVLFVTATNSHKAGGLFYSVKNLIRGVIKKNTNAKLLSFCDEFSANDLKSYQGIPMIFYHIVNIRPLKHLGYSLDINKVIKKEAPDIIHQQGIWMWHSHATILYKCKHKNTKTIITPRGMLDPWLKRNSRVVKKIIGIWYENKNLQSADCIHALCLSELNSIRKWGLKNPVAVIPNGTTIPDWKRPTLNKNKKTMLYLSRLDPKKGIDIMISSLGIIKKNNPGPLDNWTIRIGGWGNPKYVEYLKQLVDKKALKDIVCFIGSKYGSEKEQLLKDADVFILPSHSEGLPMAILEAWAYQLPVIMTDYCNLPEGFETQSAFRIDTDETEMSKQLTTFFQMSDDEIEQYGKNGLELVKKEFDWKVIAQKTITLYNWLLQKCDKPDFVYLD